MIVNVQIRLQQRVSCTGGQGRRVARKDNGNSFARYVSATSVTPEAVVDEVGGGLNHGLQSVKASVLRWLNCTKSAESGITSAPLQTRALS